jgi:hypothetical protein
MNTAAISASRLHSASHSLDPRTAMPAKPGGDHGRRCRIGIDRQMARRAEDGEQAHRDEDGVQAGDHRRADDLGVAHRPRNRQRGEGEAGDDVATDAGPVDWQDAPAGSASGSPFPRAPVSL